MRYSKVLAMLLGAIGVGGVFAAAPAEASLQVGNTSSPHEQEMAFQTAHQKNTIEALEDFLWRFGHGNPGLRLRAIYELSKFECSAGARGCGPTDGRTSDGRANGHDGRYGG